MTDDELSPGERRAFEALPRERMPKAELEERTVALLRQRGHLPTPIQLARRAGGHSARKVWIAAGAAAAAVLVFTSGVAVGQYLGLRGAVAFAVANSQSATQVNDRVRRTGDLYVAALTSLGQLHDTSDVAGREQARQTALAVLGAAAEEIAHIAPDDPLAAAVLRGLNQRNRTQGPAAPSRSVIWY